MHIKILCLSIVEVHKCTNNSAKADYRHHFPKADLLIVWSSWIHITRNRDGSETNLTFRQLKQSFIGFFTRIKSVGILLSFFLNTCLSYRFLLWVPDSVANSVRPPNFPDLDQSYAADPQCLNKECLIRRIRNTAFDEERIGCMYFCIVLVLFYWTSLETRETFLERHLTDFAGWGKWAGGCCPLRLSPPLPRPPLQQQLAAHRRPVWPSSSARPKSFGPGTGS